MPNNTYLFLSGKAHSGKDTTFKLLRYYCEEDAVRMAFADEVKRELVRINPDISFERLLRDNKYKDQYRKELIDIGDGYRQTNPKIWIDKIHEQIVKFDKENFGKIVCITDTRYKNEVQFAEDLNTILNYKSMAFNVRIKATLPSRLARMSNDGMLKYMSVGRYNPSECDLDDLPDCGFDFVVENETNHTFTELSDEQLFEVLSADTFSNFLETFITIQDKMRKTDEHYSIQPGITAN